MVLTEYSERDGVKLPTGRIMKQIIELIAQLIREKFFGCIVVKFESGKIVHIKKEESIEVEKNG
jgi:hypothetical protein